MRRPPKEWKAQTLASCRQVFHTGKTGKDCHVLPYATAARDEPLHITPWTTSALIAANVLVFCYELAVNSQGATQLNTFLLDYSLVPCEYTAHCAVRGFLTGAALIWLFQRPDSVSRIRDYHAYQRPVA
jgi:hypothetical protein